MVPNARIDRFFITMIEQTNIEGFIFGIAVLFGFFIYVAQKFILEPFFMWLR
jgi:hypothetical protein